ncbi:MAG: yigZ [Bacteroidetes bacterium]|nr:yigZ [Bacteroidota bacterium]
MTDTYHTIKTKSVGQITEKRSKFLAFAHPLESAEEVKSIVDQCRKEFYDARHVCWAYMIGPQGEQFRANDDGEPSGTAGKPILGQIKSNELTNILVLVVRYFGGIKLGTSGLIAAYKEAAAEALANATIIEKTVDEQLSFSYQYQMMNSVMRIIKELEPQIITQDYDNDCLMTLQIRKGLLAQLQQKLEKVETLRFIHT